MYFNATVNFTMAWHSKSSILILTGSSLGRCDSWVRTLTTGSLAFVGKGTEVEADECFGRMDTGQHLTSVTKSLLSSAANSAAKKQLLKRRGITIFFCALQWKPHTTCTWEEENHPSGYRGIPVANRRSFTRNQDRKEPYAQMPLLTPLLPY